MKRRSCARWVRSRSRGLLLQRPERAHLPLGGDDLFDRVDAERADQLVLEIGDAHEEAERPHRLRVERPAEAGADAGRFQRVPEEVDLALVAQSRQPEVRPVRTEPLEESPDVRRAAHRHDLDVFRTEVAAPAPRERLHRVLVTRALDQHDRARVGVRVAVVLLLAHPDRLSLRPVGKLRRPRRTVDVRAAVDEERVAGEVAAVGARQEHRDRRDVGVGVAEAAHRVRGVGRDLELGIAQQRPRSEAAVFAAGQITLAVMPYCAHSRAAVRVKARSASFAELYSAVPMCALTPFSEHMLTIRP